MGLGPVKVKWSRQLIVDEEATFVIEDGALSRTEAVFRPLFRFHNPGTESATLKIEYVFDLGSGDDPLNSGTFTVDVVDVTVAAGDFYDYNFGNITLDSNTSLSVKHNVTIKNIGTATHVYHSLLFGEAEVQPQIATVSFPDA